MTTKRENAIHMLNAQVAAENRQDLDGVFAPWVDDMQSYVNGRLVSSSKGDDRASFAATLRALPDYHREVQWIEATDDRAVMQWVVTAKHAGEWLGFTPTGNRLAWHGCSIFEHVGTSLLVGRVFTDVGELRRQLSGRLRTPGTASAASSGADILDRDRERLEATGGRLIRTVYEADNALDADAMLACYADPLLDHQYGRCRPFALTDFGPTLRRFYRVAPAARYQRAIEEAFGLGNRAVARWHLTFIDRSGAQVSQHGCSVAEHDGDRIQKFWAYYPDLVEVDPSELERDQEETIV